MRNKSFLLLSIILLSMNMAGCQTKNYREMLESLYEHSVPTISSAELKNKMREGNSMVLLDIRSKEEYQVSHLQGAKLVVYEDFALDMVSEINSDTPIVLYCSVGYRSEKIGEQLIQLGYSDVSNLYGGIFQWKNEGYSVVNSNSVETDSVHAYNKKWSRWLIKGIKVY